MQANDMGSIIVSLLESSATGLETVMKDFKANSTPVTPQTFTIDVKFVWMTDFTLASKTKASFGGWGLSVSEQLSLKAEDKQTFTIEIKAELVPIAAPPQAAA
jgi:hypothetical protein